jgi:hypothetical protein
MLRKTLLTAAVGVLISPVAMAGDINSTSEKTGWTNELLGLANATNVVTGGQLGLVLGAEFAVNDVITLAFSGESLDPTTLPSTVTGAAAGFSTVTLGLLSGDASTATYRVTEVDTLPGNTTVGLPIVIAAGGALAFDPPAVAASGGVTVSYSAETNNGLPLDTGSGPVINGCVGFNCNSRTTPYIQTAAQFGVETGPVFDAVVDVNTQRTTLIPAPDDVGRFDATNNNTAGAVDTAFEGVTVVFSVDFVDHDPSFAGNFGWITDTDPNTAGIQPGAGVVVLDAGACTSTTITATAISAVGCDQAFAQLTLNPAAQAPNLTTLPATTYTAATDVNYTNGLAGFPANTNDGTLPVSGINVGSWDLNGFQAEVAYMPYQPGITQIIYFANRSSQDGEITIDWIGQDGSSDSFTIGDSLAGTTARLSDLIKNGLPAAQQDAGRLALTITVNVPACEGQLNAQYNVSGDRAFSAVRDNCPVDTKQH